MERLLNLAPISNPSVFIKPSHKLLKYITELHISSDTPPGIAAISTKRKLDNTERKPVTHEFLATEEDLKFIKSLSFKTDVYTFPDVCEDFSENQKHEALLNLEDIHWLYKKIQENNAQSDLKPTYLHELLENSEIILPKNPTVPRNEELEKRCQFLKAQQQNREYQAITKNVDSIRKCLPEDTIAYQMGQINKQLIAIAQFIISVLAGFAFGFLGVELIIGHLDFGFRLLLGIICSLIIALAELYFLAKKLNEDLNYEAGKQVKTKNLKVD